jgi:hypothetical protein
LIVALMLLLNLRTAMRCAAGRDARAELFERWKFFYNKLNYVDQFAANSDGCEPEWRAT